MAKILRCPACGALWRFDDVEADETLRCGECGTVFSLSKAETASVDDVRLEEALRAKIAPEDPAAKGEAAMSALAEDLAEFDSRAEAPAKSGGFGILKALVALLLLVVLAAAALLYFHRPVLQQMPALRVIYQDVCRTLPCPGFVWFEPAAITVTGRLEEIPAIAPAETPATDANAANGTNGTSGANTTAGAAPAAPADAPVPVVVALTIANTTDRPQYLPTLEVKLLDPAGDTIAQRLLEPADYGYPQTPAVLAAGDSVATRVTVTTPLPHGASNVAVKAVDPLL